MESSTTRRRVTIVPSSLTSSLLFRTLVSLLALALCLCTWLSAQVPQARFQAIAALNAAPERQDNALVAATTTTTRQAQGPPPHLYPRLSHLPIFPLIPNEETLINQTLYHNQPTVAGIAAILYRFLRHLHASHERIAAAEQQQQHEPLDIFANRFQENYFGLVQEYLRPLDRAYQGRSIFPVRNDDSIFVSIAAFREHLLADTLQSAYAHAARPDQLFVGVVLQNCFWDHECWHTPRVVGMDKNGHDKLEFSNGVADPNHIATFCNLANFSQYCDNGQVRVLYVNETEALGPAVARYLTSKLWGGETYYVQIDSHLQFAKNWDDLYIQDLKLARNYPKAILSTYPPGFVNFRLDPPFTPGTRLCRCQLRQQEGFLPRVEMEGRCHANDTKPTQMSFMGAGFFFARAEFLVDVPFDPFLLYLFMGEEVALSIRAWTQGWNIYAPRQNLIGHQYRPVS